MQPIRDPLDGTVLLLVDATNVLHAIARRLGGRTGGGSDDHGPGPEPARPAPMAALVGRMRAAIPPGVRIELVFDGAPEREMRGTRIASGTTVRFAGRMSADAAILDRLGHGRGPVHPDALQDESILVVTDDRALGAAVRARGGRTAGSTWLMARLDRPRLASPAAGNRRPPRSGASIGGPAPRPGAPAEDEDRQGWKPGRGATTKRGNAKRTPRHR